jgi:predicted N-acyltransferase
MSIAVEILTSIAQLDPTAYDSLRRSCAASAFYDPRFLSGVERAPLLPVEKTYYLAAYEGASEGTREGNRLVAFMPAYLQSPSVVDPFGVLQQTTSARFEPGARGLFSHVMHCYDSTILGDGRAAVLAAMFERLTELGRAEGARHFVLMNVAEGPLLAAARGAGLEVSYMFDRFHLDLSGLTDFEALVEALPSDGRHEMRRQHRKFAASGARAVVESAPLARLGELTELCHLTTKRKGTPQYLPPAPLAGLVSSCGDMLRFVMVYVGDRIAAGLICIDDGPVFHLWLGGMTYEGLDFSPYTIAVAEGYRYALARGKRRVEAGRLNAKIKHRLGLSPMPLYSIVSPNLVARDGASARSPRPAVDLPGTPA